MSEHSLLSLWETDVPAASLPMAQRVDDASPWSEAALKEISGSRSAAAGAGERPAPSAR